MSITMRALDSDNLKACFALSITDEQRGQSQIPEMPELLGKLVPDPDVEHRTFYAGETMVGYAAYERVPDTNGFEIKCFLIDQQWQGCGYGKIAFEKLLTELKANPDCTLITIRYMDFNDAARALYAKFGFRELIEESGYVDALLCLTNNPTMLSEDLVKVANRIGITITKSDIAP